MDENVKRAVEEFAERIKRYYTALQGTASTSMIVYHVEQIKNDILNKEDQKNGHQ